MDATTKPLVTRASRSFDLEGGLRSLEPGDPVLILGEVDGQVLCFAGEDRLFRLESGSIGGLLDPAGPDAALPSGIGEKSAMGLVLSLLIAGCAGLNEAESCAAGGIESFGDALWYGINTISTVGVGDVAPETPLGKLIASGLMVVGNPLYAKFGEEITGSLLGGGREGIDDLARQVARIVKATS